MRTRPHAAEVRRVLPGALALALVLQFAQWLGLAHRIEHPLPTGLFAPAITLGDAHDPAGDPDDEARHDCAAVDAACLGHAAAAQAIAWPVAAPDCRRGAQPLRGINAAAPRLGFQSRAPPRT